MPDLENTPLVETGWLARHLADPNLRIVDMRWRGAGQSGLEMYRAGHLPGAVHLDWERDLSWTDQAGLRFQLLPPGRFAAVMSRAGIGDSTPVVAYADEDYSGAARLWWALKFYGHRQVAVLNGGWDRWIAENRPVSQTVVAPVPAEFMPRPQPDLRADAAEIMAALHRPRPALQLVDTRPPEQFLGQAVWTPPGSHFLDPGAATVEIGARRPMRAGHIPGARNLTSSLNLNPQDWTFRPPETLRELAAAAGLKAEERTITYCGVGISASLGLFALHLAGFKNLALYDASWEEWGTSPGFPVA